MSTPVQGGPAPAAEELVLGPRDRRRPPRWLVVSALLAGLVVAVGAGVWWWWPRPPEPLDLAELQGVYEGMVRSDGTNDASVLTRESVAETPVTVAPADCAPLVETTVANRFPVEALDGVGTYWLGRGSTISLFTLRFDTAAQTDAEVTRVRAAVQACDGAEVLVRRSGTDRVRAWQVTVDTVGGRTPADGVSYLMTGPDGVMAVQLLPYLNTLTWQYRYETGTGDYSPLAADQLMQGLHAQLEAVVAARPG